MTKNVFFFQGFTPLVLEQLQVKDRTIQDKLRIIAEKDALIAEKEALIAQKDALIAQKDIRIAQLETLGWLASYADYYGGTVFCICYVCFDIVEI